LVFSRKKTTNLTSGPLASPGEYYPGVSKTRSSRGLLKALATAAIIVAIFGLGFAAGRGDIAIRNQLASTANHGLPADLDYSSVEEVYDRLKEAYDGQMNADKLLEGVKRGLVAATNDPYTEYFNPTEAKDFADSLSGSFTGIGAELGKNGDDQIIIVAPLAGYPAEKAGLKPQDIIANINGQSTSGISLSSAVRQIRGEEGTTVKLTIVRNSDQPFDVSIVRQKINLPSVEYKIENGIGYLKLNQFNDATPSEARAAAKEFIAKDVRGTVVDLRGNPGGYLSGAVDVSSLWLPSGTVVVSERRGNKVVSTERANGSSPLKGLPTIVLIDKGSASASEIMAGALRDHKAAKIVGVKSFGKGSVQRIDGLGGGGELKITIARWFTPSGNSIDKSGITPDYVVEISKDATAGQDPQKDKALELLNKSSNT